MTQWLEHHMLPCAYKQLFGIDCPICGFQRALILLLKGDIVHSFLVYPPLIPILLLFVLAILHLLKTKPINQKLFRNYSFVLFAIIMTNYIVKLVYAI